MFHTLGLVKREVMDEDIDGESDIRVEIEREAVQKSAAVVAASKIELDELRRLYRADASHVAVIPCGVDPALFHPVRQADAREKLGRDQCERIILFVGRIEQIKGIDVLLRRWSAVSRHPDMRSDICLLVVGGALDRVTTRLRRRRSPSRRLVHSTASSRTCRSSGRGTGGSRPYYAARILRGALAHRIVRLVALEAIPAARRSSAPRRRPSDDHRERCRDSLAGWRRQALADHGEVPIVLASACTSPGHASAPSNSVAPGGRPIVDLMIACSTNEGEGLMADAFTIQSARMGFAHPTT
jgi:glycosyltransferase involved in cell wall biosynthesis